MALAAMSPSSSTIEIGGTVGVTSVASSSSLSLSSSSSSSSAAVPSTTTTTTTATRNYDKSRIGSGNGEGREPDENTGTSSRTVVSVSDSITPSTASASLPPPPRPPPPLSTQSPPPPPLRPSTSVTTLATERVTGIAMDSVAHLASTDDILLDELSSRFHGVLPIQPSPLLLPSDHISSSLKSTRLNGHLIYCFVIGGECRLCFPQIISVVLRGVAISDINELFVDLNIHISVASQQQLDTLKLAGVMPMTADSCGLVTKSDAERLVAKLLPQCSGYRLTTDNLSDTDTIPVVHDCFDGCTGTLIPMLDTDEQIECSQCKLLFTGEKFVSHSHSIQQIRRICHWGFDSSNWRHYLHLPESYEDDMKALQKLELYKYPPIRLGKRSASNGLTVI
uniref:C-SKI SMAD4-binding domain-containing protein n=1 Tax=Setaria digitata TaxID=48799 RepID=A0A915PRY2_9BILA